MLEIEFTPTDNLEVQSAARVLQNLADRFDLEPFLFTRCIRLDPALGRGGMSHPILSLGVLHAREPDRFLSVFLHEQMHWFLCACDLNAVDAAIDEFRSGWSAVHEPCLKSKISTKQRKNRASAYWDFSLLLRYQNFSSSEPKIVTTQPIFKTVINRATFESEGEILVGNLYLPENVRGKVGAFVIIGPMTFQKEQAPTEYAKRLAQKGYAALVFDPRYRGESSGEPRALEHPQAKVEDINNAVAFMATQSGIDRERIFGLGICQGSSEMLRAVAENPAIKAGVTLAGHYRDREGDIAWLGEEGYQQRLTQGKRAQEKYERTGEVDYVAAVDERDMNVGMPGKFVWDWYHVWADKGLWDNRYAVMSDAYLLGYESIDAAKILTKPYLMIHSDNSFLPAAAKRHFEAMPSTQKQLLWEGATPHLDYYDKPEIIDSATTSIADWIESLR